MARQAEPGPRLSVQRAKSGRHREGRGRERHAPGDRSLECPAATYRRLEYPAAIKRTKERERRRERGPRPDAKDARCLWCRYSDSERAAAESKPAVRGHRFVPRRPGGTLRFRTRTE